MPEKIKRLANRLDAVVKVKCPVSPQELLERNKDYPNLSRKEFAKRTLDFLYRPVKFVYKGIEYKIQYNFCTDPFCSWFGLPQETLKSLRRVMSRYRLSGTGQGLEKAVIACNEAKYDVTSSYVSNRTATVFSNWAIADEIARLAQIEKTINWKPNYKFHKDGCTQPNSTPFNELDKFYAYGKSTSNSQRWQCLACKKITNVLPEQMECYTYKQRRNDILVEFFDLIIRGIAVKEICGHFNIGMQTYYNKLEWVYRRCLEFLERHEKKGFSKLQINKLWLNTDQMVYLLNNIRKKGHGKKAIRLKDEPRLETRIIATGDLKSQYIFRADINFDWDMSLEQIEADTLQYKENHVHEFARKNARFRFQYKPQPPIEQDTATKMEYMAELEEFERRASYVDGLHVNPTYTAIAHYWHIRNMINVKKWNIATDSDHSLMTALFRIFAQEIKDGYAHHFIYKIDENKRSAQAKAEFLSGTNALRDWAYNHGLSFLPGLKYQTALLKLKEDLKRQRLYSTLEFNGRKYQIPTGVLLQHPIPSNGYGYYDIGCTSDLSMYNDDYIAKMLLRVSGKTTDTFFEKLRRKVNTLERPLDTARPGEKCYIYANYNPRYAQYLTTILRTVHNFCTPIKTKNGPAETPAQRLKLVDKQYTIKDILYMR